MLKSANYYGTTDRIMPNKRDLRSHRLVSEKAEDPLARNGQPQRGRRAENNAVGLARIRAPVDRDSNAHVVQTRQRRPSVHVRRAQTRAEVVHHSLRKLHHASFPFRRRNN
ncbi:hypothetical protein ACMD2_04153 [Ananas comosus]|uniref:Uncharacterized protein n=1 Tax=Ananas comosus TaxID=4615 RepID=A0A199W8L6_ANACO|nr:hypothetical protein ACMD2_04153 [Ananas comosus]